MDEVAECGDELRAYLRQEITVLLENDDFLDALPGHLMDDPASQARAELVVARLRAMSER